MSDNIRKSRISNLERKVDLLERRVNQLEDDQPDEDMPDTSEQVIDQLHELYWTIADIHEALDLDHVGKALRIAKRQLAIGITC
jgi:hypothetical protein